MISLHSLQSKIGLHLLNGELTQLPTLSITKQEKGHHEAAEDDFLDLNGEANEDKTCENCDLTQPKSSMLTHIGQTKVSFLVSVVTNNPNQKFNIPISIDISIKDISLYALGRLK